MILLDLQPEIEAQLSAEAQARGLTLDQYLEALVSSRPMAHSIRESPADAVAAIRELRKGNRLNGLSVSDLIHEGRMY